jgi:hypothetical protein
MMLPAGGQEAEFLCFQAPAGNNVGVLHHKM